MEYKTARLLTAEQVADMVSVDDPALLMTLAKRGKFPRPVYLAGSKKQIRWIEEDLIHMVNVLARDRETFAPPDKKSIVTPHTGEVPECLARFKDDLASECDIPGIYFLVKKSAVVYVGLSIDPPKRVQQHVCGSVSTTRKDFDTVLYLPVPIEELIEKEKLFIALLDPPLNISGRRPDLAPVREMNGQAIPVDGV